MGFKGYDYFVAQPGAVEIQRCQVCDAECRAERDVMGPDNYISGIAHIFRLHDYFTCPYTDEPWHKEALELCRAIDHCPSESVRKLMRDDFNRLLQTR